MATRPPAKQQAAESKKAPHAGGRPSLYNASFNERAYRLCLLGLTDKELAVAFGICEATLNNWKHEHPKFLESINAGKDEADAVVADRLFQRACGYSHPAVKVFSYEGDTFEHEIVEHYPPDTNAARYWLNNRQRGRWRDRAEVSGPDGAPLRIVVEGGE